MKPMEAKVLKSPAIFFLYVFEHAPSANCQAYPSHLLIDVRLASDRSLTLWSFFVLPKPGIREQQQEEEEQKLLLLKQKNLQKRIQIF